MDAKVRKHLENYIQKRGWKVSDKMIQEVLEECGTELHEETVSQHRWYDVHRVFKMIDGMLISYERYYTTGDMNPDDMGLEFDFNAVHRARAKEVKTVVYEIVEDEK